MCVSLFTFFISLLHIIQLNELNDIMTVIRNVYEVKDLFMKKEGKERCTQEMYEKCNMRRLYDARCIIDNFYEAIVFAIHSVYRELGKRGVNARRRARAPSVARRKSNIDLMLILLLSYEGFVPNRIIYSPVNANSYTLPRPGVRESLGE